jgi:hypothetical protein
MSAESRNPKLSMAQIIEKGIQTEVRRDEQLTANIFAIVSQLRITQARIRALTARGRAIAVDFISSN